MTLLRRRDATQATLDRFKGKPFTWGKWDCAQMALFHLRGMGHEVRLAKVGAYNSALGAKRAIRRLGFDNLVAAMDSRFPRIAPAEAVAGDMLALPADAGLGAIVVALGNGAAIGWHQDAEGAVAMRMEEFVAAWRVDPNG
jgi:hypothetical protein